MKLFTKILNSGLIKDTGIYTIVSIINALIPFLLLPVLTEYLSPTDYGTVSMFTLIVTFTMPFIGINANAAITRKYYDRDKIDFPVYVYNSLVVLISSTLIVALIFFIAGDIISKLTKFPKEFLWSVLLYLFCMGIVNILLAIWQVQKFPKAYGIIVLVKTLINMSLSLFLIVNYAFGWEGRVYGQIVSELLISIVALFILTNRKYIKMKLKYEYIVDSLKYGLPLIPHVLSTSIISMTDRLFISQAEGLAVTGIYTVGYQIGSVMNLITMSFNNAFVPWLFQKLKDDNYDAKKRIVKFTYYYFFLLIGAAIFLGVAAPSVLNFIVSDSYSGSSIYVIWIALGYAFNGMYLMVVNYIFYAERNGLLSIVTFSTAILNVILNYFFVGWYGAIGAAQATSIIFGVKMIMVWILSARVYKMPWLMNRERRYN